MTKLLVGAVALYLLYHFLLKPRPRMPQDEARAVLGVGADADSAEIRAAHRRLVAAVHPDKGGSAELTRRINAARDALLK